MVTGLKIDDDILTWVNASVARGDGNEGSTAVNHYKKWCVARGDAILRPLDPLLTTLEVKAREVIRIARFALFLVQHQGVSASSASGYISTVNASDTITHIPPSIKSQISENNRQ